MRGRTMLPSVHGPPPRWRASSRVEWFSAFGQVRNHRVRSRCVMGTFDRYLALVSLSRVSLRFSLVEGVLGLLAGLLEVALGLICLAFAFHLLCLLYTSPSPRDGLLSRMPS